MRKGEEKRQQLLDAAEGLFCQKGYEGTSVQDILNAATLSKGGFYHHFASKEEVIHALCKRRGERAAAYTVEALKQANTPLGRINAVLYGFIPLRIEEASYVKMVLEGIDRPEGRAVAMSYQDSLAKHFLPLLQSEVANASAAGVVFPPVKDMESIILHTVNHCWMEVAALMKKSLQENSRLDQLALLGIMEKYRRAVEVLLDAPYGTMEIIRIEEVNDLMRSIA